MTLDLVSRIENILAADDQDEPKNYPMVQSCCWTFVSSQGVSNRSMESGNCVDQFFTTPEDDQKDMKRKNTVTGFLEDLPMIRH
ncbi:hypothetical protein TNCV_276071 [Trichonephila clavipes]|nr:hypothetical protein TNCV_276071 [Trichonephila clavipes]